MDFGGGSNPPNPEPTVGPPNPTPSPTVGPPPTGGSWAPNTAYAIGARVTYNGLSYQCRQAHTSLPGWEPPNVASLWQQI